uniref:Uncharacterized protein n=1 Tax=Panagrolaimus sp. ES5 TaxID=591445 RepID=A0AC34FUQ5_9BILA
MEYFGINIDCGKPHNVIRKEKFTNYLRNDIFDGKKVELKDMKREDWPYIPCPMLFNRFNLLNFYTYKMEDGSLLTNCNTLKSLALERNCTYAIFTHVEIVENVQKTFYVLHAEKKLNPPPSTDQQKLNYHRNLHVGKCLEATLKQKIDDYRTFACYHKTMTINDSLVNIHYTHKIDLFDKEMNPIEVKALFCPGKTTAKTKEQKLNKCFKHDRRVDTVIQCKIGEVQKIIFGLHDGINNKAEIFQMTLAELEKGDVKAEAEAEARYANMKLSVKKIMEKCKLMDLEGKAVRIQNIEPLEWEEIDKTDLIKTYGFI